MLVRIARDGRADSAPVSITNGSSPFREGPYLRPVELLETTARIMARSRLSPVALGVNRLVRVSRECP